ncbi:MAG: hypothetical protein WD468_02675 [Pirellulales bacterium]
MWCSTCHQDVPGVANATGGRTVCARCQQPLHTVKASHASKICDEGLALDEPAAKLAAAAPPLGGLDWQSSQLSRRMGRQLRRPAETPTTIPPIRTKIRRFDPPQNLLNEIDANAAPAFAPFTAESTPTSTPNTRQTEASQVIAWLIVFAGVLALTGGLGLIGWSLAGAELRYWNEAIGLTLGGQGLLIFGLVLVVTRLWRNSRYASNKLQDVTARLTQLQHTADALTAMRGGAPTFYADLVRGASPQALLANLKGQLDQLATRLGNGW